MSYIVYIYPQPGTEPELTLHLYAKNWQWALKKARMQLGGPASIDNLYIRALTDGFTAEVSDPQLAKCMRLRSTDKPLSIPIKGWCQGSDYNSRSRITPVPMNKGFARELTPVPHPERYTIWDPDPPQNGDATYHSPEYGVRPSDDRISFHREAFTQNSRYADDVAQGPPTEPEITPSHKTRAPSTEDQLDLHRLKAKGENEVSFTFQPGQTDAFLTDAFMKMAQLDELFRSNTSAAMRFVMDFLWDRVDAHGAGIFCIELDEHPRLVRCCEARGEYAETLLNATFLSTQGVLGASVKRGVGLNVANLAKTDYPNESLLSVVPEISSLLVIPMQHEQFLQGLIIMYRYSNYRPFTQGEANILSYVAHRLGEYLYLRQVPAPSDF